MCVYWFVGVKIRFAEEGAGGSQDGLWISGREREGEIGGGEISGSAKISGCRSKGPLQRPLWVVIGGVTF